MSINNNINYLGRELWFHNTDEESQNLTFTIGATSIDAPRGIPKGEDPAAIYNLQYKSDAGFKAGLRGSNYRATPYVGIEAGDRVSVSAEVMANIHLDDERTNPLPVDDEHPISLGFAAGLQFNLTDSVAFNLSGYYGPEEHDLNEYDAGKNLYGEASLNFQLSKNVWAKLICRTQCSGR